MLKKGSFTSVTWRRDFFTFVQSGMEEKENPLTLRKSEPFGIIIIAYGQMDNRHPYER